ncbi:MAG: hypothetical protein CMF60_01400 [Magnetococcales bacterium]|nr:hypothetical protein [Magnetococcales bacterium]|tara:strand:+ start:372 stop:1631 length:1260 start_codon:yes stop_codon:yes gene_type:complete
MNNYKELIFSSMGAQAYLAIAHFVVLWLTLNILGSENRGIYIVMLTWVQFFSGISHLSLGQTILNRAIKSSGLAWLAHTVGTSSAVALLVSLFSCFLMAVGFFLFPAFFGGSIPKSFFYVMLLAVPLFVWLSYNRSILISLGKLDVAYKNDVVSQTIMLLLMPLMYVVGIYGAAISLLASKLLTTVMGAKVIASCLSRKPKISKVSMKSYLFKSLALHPAIICSVFIGYTDILMINYFLGVVESGFYQMAVQLLAMMLIVPQVVSNVLFTLCADHGITKAWLKYKKIVILTCGFMLLSSVFAFLLAPYIIPMVLGDLAVSSVPVFKLLLFTILGQSLAALMSPQWIGRGLFKTVSGISAFTVVVNIALNYLFIPKCGIEGAAYTTIIVHTFSILVNGGLFVYIWREFTLKNRTKVEGQI